MSDTPPGNDFVAVAAGFAHNIALREDSSLVSWGLDRDGQVSGTPSGNDFVAVAAGTFASYAIQVPAADELPPAIHITNPAVGTVYVLGEQVLADYACTDEDDGSGLASCTGTVASGEPIPTTEVGTHTFVVEAADAAGNTATLTHTYTVAYDFRGFFPPVKNDGAFNKAKAGRTIPLKWRLLDADGEPVTDLTGVDVTVEDVSCGRDQTHDWKKAGAGGWMRWVRQWHRRWRDGYGGWHRNREGLKHLGNGYYRYKWKTARAYARSCKALHLDLGEGMTRTALFRFK